MTDNKKITDQITENKANSKNSSPSEQSENQRRSNSPLQDDTDDSSD